jgi:signal transduction histidine kinase
VLVKKVGGMKQGDNPTIRWTQAEAKGSLRLKARVCCFWGRTKRWSVISSARGACRLGRILVLLGGLHVLLSQGAFAQAPSQDWSQSFEGRSDIHLLGSWEFFWNRVIQPGDQVSRSDAQPIFQESWTGFQIAEETYPRRFGVATYRLILGGLPEQANGYTIFLSNIFSSYHAQLYSRHQRKVLAETRQGDPLTKQPPLNRGTALLSFAAEEGDVYELLIVVGNQSMFYAGMTRPPILSIGAGEPVRVRVQTYVNLFALGCILGTGIYLFMLWWRHRKDRMTLALAVIAFASFIRLFTTTSALASLLPLSWHELIFRLEFVCIPMGLVSYLYFLWKITAHEGLKRPAYVLIGASILCLLHMSLSPLYALQSAITIYQLQVLANCMFYILCLILAFKQRIEGRGLIIGGCGLIVGAVFFDIAMQKKLFLQDFGLTLFSTPLAVASFLVIQAQFVAKRAADAYDKAESYALELVQKEEARTIFFHNSSHELRTPLNGIIGFLELIRQDTYGPLPSAVRGQVDKVLQLAEGLKRQVNTILDLAKSRRGELRLKRQQVSLTDLKQDLDLLSEGLRHKNTVLLSYESQLQERVPLQPFIGDQEKIFTILRNLVGNAFKFSSPGRHNHVSVKIIHDQDGLQIEVHDTGIGIPHEFQERIFEEFFQVQGHARRAFEGTGLGLSMVSDMVKMMGGTIKVHSIPGQGTTFVLSIPSQGEVDVLQADQEEVPQVSSVRSDAPMRAHLPPQKVPQGSSDYRILTIDDNDANCEVMTAILKGAGYQALSESSGHAGLQRMKAWKPHLVLLDMMMPELSGEDVYRLMQEDPELAPIPVILITARASEEDRIHGLSLGVDDYLAKPIIADEVKLRVGNMLRRHELLKHVERKESTEPLIQLGELFHDLSHEMSNIMQGAASVRKLELYDSKLLLGESLQTFEWSEPLAKSMVTPFSLEPKGLTSLLSVARDDPQALVRKSLRSHLELLDLKGEESKAIWNYSLTCGPDALGALESKIRIILDYGLLYQATESSRTIMLNVLTFTRSQVDSAHCELERSLEQVRSLVSTRLRKHRISWECASGQSPQLKISQGSCLQILLNLVINACDAVHPLPMGERWIRCEWQQDEDVIHLRLSNGGPTIAPDIAERIFERGFTTKGRNGSGLGLALSRQLAARAGGSLILDSSQKHPTFVLTIPCEKDEHGSVAS